MKYAVVNSSFFSLSSEDGMIFHSNHTMGENLSHILKKYLPPGDKITGLYICSGPGSLISSRGLISFCLGVNIYQNFSIYYLDSLRDVLLGDTTDGVALFPLTPSLFILGCKQAGIYSYKFMQLGQLIESLEGLPSTTVVKIDPHISIIHQSAKEQILSYPNKIISWNSLDLFNCKVNDMHLKSIVNYSFW
jgi:hypothetical protein